MKKVLFGLALALLASSTAHGADLGGKLMKVGSDTTSPPMESVDTATGQIVGFDVDVIQAVCDTSAGNGSSYASDVDSGKARWAARISARRSRWSGP